ncbi:MAG TPA: methyl-accepting chemotaxis protein, partial [Defluviitoga tunisiensis]|nr:methyl-accepting chemotaxis protein [Defluviitoga tunisiensis]
MLFNSIKKKISVIIIVVLVLFGAAISFNIFSLVISNRGLERYKNLSDESSKISEIEMNFFDASLSLKDYVSSYEEQNKEIIIKNISNIKTMFTDYNQDSASFLRLKTNVENYENAFNQIVEQNKRKEQLIKTDFQKISESLVEASQKFKNLSQKSISSAMLTYSDNVSQLISEAIVFCSNYFLSKSITDKDLVFQGLEELNSLFNRINYEITYGIVTDDLKFSFEELQNVVLEFKKVFNQIVEAIESQDPIIQEMEQLRVE